MSANKFLKRLVAQNQSSIANKGTKNKRGTTANEDTYKDAILSDPVAHLAIVLSAVIHDVDHQGVSNAQLAKEDPTMASRYKAKSLAEQNSFGMLASI